VTMRRWTIGITAVIGLLGAFAQPPITEPLLTDSAWPTWGRDMRRSHFVDDLAGPNTPAVLWFTRGGALEEPGIPGNSLWVPQHPAQGARYTRYTFYNPVTGRATGSFGPFWGQPSTPIFLNAAVFIVDNNGNFRCSHLSRGTRLCFRVGSMSACCLAPAPSWASPMSSGRSVGFPRTAPVFGAFTDGFYIYPVFADNFGNITVLFLGVVCCGITNTFQIAGCDCGLWRSDYRSRFPSAALSSVSSNQSGSTPSVGLPQRAGGRHQHGYASTYAWFTNIPTLSNSGSGPEVPSDSVDRPIAVTSNNQTAIVCASNSGRVYGVR
jgi:hypothetical protein